MAQSCAVKSRTVKGTVQLAQCFRKSPASADWKCEIGLRLRGDFLAKLLGTALFTWIFFIGYFQVLRLPANAVTLMPMTALDRLVPFQPEAPIAYFSLWLYVGVGPGLQWSLCEVVVYALWVGALCLAGLGIFYCWPTEVPPLVPYVSDFPGFALLHGVDASQNACPSMHVATAPCSRRCASTTCCAAPARRPGCAWATGCGSC
jgi:hypothetical protein